MARRQQVRAAVYDVLGRRVLELFVGVLGAGATRALTFEAGSLPGGRYVIRAEGKHFTAARTVTLLK